MNDSWGPLDLGDGTFRFRIWAPDHDTLTVRVDGRDHTMTRASGGWFETVAPAGDGSPYVFVLPDGHLRPDPAARAQMGDVHGPSRVTVPGHAWRHDAPRTPWAAAVIYECHIGAFTPEGTFRAAIDHLPHLADLGITVLEIMPVAHFAGSRGWGYDSVLPYAPHPAYGTPDDLRALVDAAHGYGIQVLLDVVHNHFGPDGNYIAAFASQDFFDHERQTPWGAGIDYSRVPVRRYFIDNALYWLDEFRFDGLRLDAIDHIRDPSDPEILVQMAREIRERHPNAQLTTEDNRNITRLHERDGTDVPLMTAEWNDDWHNAAHVLLTGETDGYYETFAVDTTAMLAQSMAHGFSTDGAGGNGVDSAHLPPAAFIDFLQNHDQTGNRAMGDRLTTLAGADKLAAMQAVLLLSPHIPLVFMGDEWAETRPFLFFSDFQGDLKKAVTEGRRREFAAFTRFAGEDVPDPNARSTFEASRIDWSARTRPEGRAAMVRFHELLAIRRRHIAPHLRHAEGNFGQVVDAPEGCLAVDWLLDGVTLRARANLTEAHVDLPPAAGKRIHLTGKTPGAPASVAFWIDR